MNKILTLVALFIVVSLGFVASSQASPMAQNGLKTFDTSKLIGLTVKARDGVQLGQIFDLVADSNGHLDFAIVTQPSTSPEDGLPDRLVVVPFGTLMISQAKSNNMGVIFTENKEKFYEGPDLGNENLSNLNQAASVDRHYGIQPYWTAATGKAACRK